MEFTDHPYMKSSLVKYKTKPLESWNKAKELRRNHYQEVARAREEGKLIVTGGTEGFIALPAGLGDYVFFGGEPYGATVGNAPEFSAACSEAVEARGFARDLCAYMRNYWGSMFLGKYYFGGPFPKPDFCLQMHMCDSHSKWWQQVSEYYGVPYFSIEVPLIYPKREFEEAVEYMASQLHEAVEWMGKITGRPYDDEKLIEATRNELLCQSLWGEICILNRNTPAPLDQKSLFALYVICVLIRHKKESVEFYRMLKDEVERRVEQKIAALATERCRLLDDCQPPWALLEIYRYLEKFGAVTVGSLYSFSLTGTYEVAEDYSLSRKKMPEEEGIEIKSREDCLRLMARWFLERPVNGNLFFPDRKSGFMRKAVEQWHCQGVIMHLNRGCELFCTGVMENKIALQEAGIPVLTYEGNMGDKREIDKAQIFSRLDAFMESLGLGVIDD